MENQLWAHMQWAHSVGAFRGMKLLGHIELHSGRATLSPCISESIARTAQCVSDALILSF